MNATENLRRLQGNVVALRNAGISDEEIDAYLGQEGYTHDAFMEASQRLAALGPAKPADVGFGGRAASSALFNFGDEIAAATRASGASYMPGPLGALGGFVDAAFYDGKPAAYGNFEGELAAARMGLDEYARQNPKSAIAADVSGALLPAIATGGMLAAGRGTAGAINAARASTAARAAPTALANAGNAAKIGAIEGAVGGFGAGEGAEGRLRGAGTGAAGGAALGGVFSAAATAGRASYNALRPKAGRVAEDARRYFMNLINAEGESLAGASQELARREGVGVGDNIVADVMGPAFRSEMGGATSASAEFRRDLTDLLNNRARQQAEKTRGALSSATDGQVMNTAREAANRLTAARAQVDPLYAQFRARQPFVNDPVLTDLMTQRPALEDALTTTQRSLLNRGMVDPSGVEMIDSFRFDPKTLALEPIQEARATLTPMAIDRMAKITGEAAADQRNPALSAAQRNLASDTMAARGDLLNRVDELAPEYAEARRIFAGAKEYGDLSRAGRQFLDADSETAEALLRQLPEASQTGQQGFREGTLDALRQRLEKSENIAGRINQATPRIADKEAMDRLLDAFPNLRGQPYEKLVQQLDALAQQSSTRNQFQGRQTRGATGSAVSEDAATQFTAGELASGLFQQNLIPGITGAAVRGVRGAAKEASQETRAAAAPFFLAQGSRNIEPFFDELARQRASDLTSDALARNVPGLAGGGAASATVSANAAGLSGKFGVSEDDAVGPDRKAAAAEIKRIEQILASGQVAPADAATFRQQQARLRELAGL